MKRLDLWLGKNLFQPPIILLCQLTGMTQYAVHRYLWWVVMLYMVWRIDSDDHWFWKTILIAWGICHTVSAGLAPDRPLESNNFMRRFFLVFLIIEAISVPFGKPPSVTLLPILFAEYALTIKTIPPRQTKEVAGNARRIEA